MFKIQIAAMGILLVLLSDNRLPETSAGGSCFSFFPSFPPPFFHIFLFAFSPSPSTKFSFFFLCQFFIHFPLFSPFNFSLQKKQTSKQANKKTKQKKRNSQRNRGCLLLQELLAKTGVHPKQVGGAECGRGCMQLPLCCALLWPAAGSALSPTHLRPTSPYILITHHPSLSLITHQSSPITHHPSLNTHITLPPLRWASWWSTAPSSARPPPSRPWSSTISK